MAKDPVCGMDVLETSERHAEYDGERFYFCSEGCQHKFQQDPGQFIHGGHDHPAEHVLIDEPVDESAIYTCPMHPEVEQQGPGSCPKCGMALELKGVPVMTISRGEVMSRNGEPSVTPGRGRFLARLKEKGRWPGNKVFDRCLP